MKLVVTLEDNLNGLRLDKAISSHFDITRSSVSKLSILVNGKEAKLSQKVEIGDVIEFSEPIKQEIDLSPKDMGLKVVYEDIYLAIIDKPADLVVHPSDSFKGDTLVNGIRHIFKELSSIDPERPGIVHRLDKDTSGLIVIAKDNDTHMKLSNMFKEHNLTKTYLAILKGRLKENTVRIESYIGRDKKDRKKMSSNSNNGKLAISIFKEISYNNGYTLAKVEILTGRTHQIRVHSKELGCPVMGDSTYTRDNKGRQQLHAYMLEFKHPITEKDIKVVSNIPVDMLENIKRLGLVMDNA